MATITEELRLALREFKTAINGFNFVVNFEEPPFPIGSLESYQAQLALAEEYLEKHPELNDKEFNHLGAPLYVKESCTRKIETELLLRSLDSNTKASGSK